METEGYPSSAMERAMKVQEVILRAMAKKLTWLQAADILGVSPRTMRRLRWKFEKQGCKALVDRRKRTPSSRRAPVVEVRRVLGLYRDKYDGFNVRHFVDIVRERHGSELSYTTIKNALQAAGLVKKARTRGKHRRRRAPKDCFGEMLHIDGSTHAWLLSRPEERQTLITVVDDATGRLLFSQLFEAESTENVMRALRAVFEKYGLPMALYSDRAGWAAHTPKAGGAVDKSVRTQVGRALDTLGIEQILAYSPQARGRSERVHRTQQDRWCNEMKVAKIRDVTTANRFIEASLVPDYNRRFARLPLDERSAFVGLLKVDLDQILCVEEFRIVAKDNTVSFDSQKFQIDKQPGRRSCEGIRVLVRRHLDGAHSLWFGSRCLGRYDSNANIGPVGGHVTGSLPVSLPQGAVG